LAAVADQDERHLRIGNHTHRKGHNENRFGMGINSVA